MKRLVPTLLALAALTVACGSSTAATATRQQASSCLSKHARVSTTKAGTVYARFADQNQVGLRWSRNAAEAKAGLVTAKLFAAQFHTVVGLIGVVGYTWDRKPTPAQRNVLGKCVAA